MLLHNWVINFYNAGDVTHDRTVISLSIVWKLHRFKLGGRESNVLRSIYTINENSVVRDRATWLEKILSLSSRDMIRKNSIIVVARQNFHLSCKYPILLYPAAIIEETPTHMCDPRRKKIKEQTFAPQWLHKFLVFSTFLVLFLANYTSDFPANCNHLFILWLQKGQGPMSSPEKVSTSSSISPGSLSVSLSCALKMI
jgi:hypothetical protein